MYVMIELDRLDYMCIFYICSFCWHLLAFFLAKHFFVYVFCVDTITGTQLQVCLQVMSPLALLRNVTLEILKLYSQNILSLNL